MGRNAQDESLADLEERLLAVGGRLFNPSLAARFEMSAVALTVARLPTVVISSH